MQKYLYQDLYELEDKHWWHIAKRKSVLHFLKKYSDIKKPNILDIGCGTGKNLEEFNKVGIAWGVDNSPEAIKFCRKRGLKKLKLGEIDKLNVKNNSIQIITALDVLEHVDDKKMLKSIHKILAPGGLLILTVPALPILWSKWDEVLHHKRRYLKKDLQSSLEKNHFKILHISYMYSFLVLPALAIRTIKKLFFKNDYPSDFKLSNTFVNSFLGRVHQLEFSLVDKSILPTGSSLIAVVKKNEK